MGGRSEAPDARLRQSGWSPAPGSTDVGGCDTHPQEELHPHLQDTCLYPLKTYTCVPFDRRLSVNTPNCGRVKSVVDAVELPDDNGIYGTL